MMKLLSAIAFSVLFAGNGEKYTEVRKAVDNVNEAAPAKTWDGQYLKSVRLIEEDNVVEFNIKNVGGSIPRKENISKEVMIKNIAFLVANFMTAYDHSMNGIRGEGDDNLFKRVGPLLKLLARNDVGIRFNLQFREGGTFSYGLTPSELEKAVLLRKSDFH